MPRTPAAPEAPSLPRSLARAVILGSLATGAKHGYALVRELERLGDDPRLRARVYPMLARLEEDGLVVKIGAESQGRRSRTIFDLTDKGRAEWKSLAERSAAVRTALERLTDTEAGSAVHALPAPVASVVEPSRAEGHGSQAPSGARRTARAEAPTSALPYPCADATITFEKSARAGTFGFRITGCPIGTFDYCPKCPIFQATEPLRRWIAD
ncbi:MAG: PadR family transcriptional regulator [Thermoplasmatota archaeon]